MLFKSAILFSAFAFVVPAVALPQNLTARDAFEIIGRATLAPVYTTCVTVGMGGFESVIIELMTSQHVSLGQSSSLDV